MINAFGAAAVFTRAPLSLVLADFASAALFTPAPLPVMLADAAQDDDVYYYIRWRLELEGETENTGVCTKERKGVTAAVLMATPCTNSLGGESGGQKHEGCGGRSACWKYAAVSLGGVERRWVLLKIPRGDIDGVGEGK